MPPVDQAFEVLGQLSAAELDREVAATEERLRILRSLHRRAIVRERDEQRLAGKPAAGDGSGQPTLAEAPAAG